MSDGNGPEPTTNEPTPQDGEGKTFSAEYVEKLRQEAASNRVTAKQLKEQLEALAPLAEKAKKMEEAQKTEAEKMAERMATLQNELEAQKAAVATVQAQNRLTQLAVKAGLPVEAVNMLNVNSFDLDDEDATLAALKLLAPSKTPSGGGASNPGRNGATGQPDPAEWYKQFQSGGRTIFDR